MLGSFLARAFIMAFGYAVPAYECYKIVEKNKPDIERLRFWCQYWILIALVAILERISDVFISWFPFYYEAKLAFVVYLWHPRTRGATYVYNTFVQPYIAMHETDIDHNLLELRARAADAIIVFWQRSMTYGQARFFEILQYVASQSHSLRSRPAQVVRLQSFANKFAKSVSLVFLKELGSNQQQFLQPTQVLASKQSSEPLQQQPQSPSIPPLVSRQPEISAQEPAAAQDSAAEPVSPAVLPVSSVASQNDENATHSKSSELEENVEAQPEPSISTTEAEDSNPPPKDIVMEETIKVTLARLRKTRPSAGETAATS